jgi:glycerol-3-phosphate acyltransferase PlsY
MTVLSLLTAYLLGSIPWGLWIGRLHGLDVRRYGSGNLGATNVGRVLGKKTGILVLTLDVVKGALAVFLARSVQASAPGELAFLPAVCGTLAILGHVTTPWAGFRGGKGVATGAGVAAVLTPLALAAALGVFLAVIGATRIVALGSILAAIALPAAILLVGAAGPEEPWLVAWSFLVALLVVARHSGNVRRLLAGTEPKLGATRPAPKRDGESL